LYISVEVTLVSDLLHQDAEDGRALHDDTVGTTYNDGSTALSEADGVCDQRSTSKAVDTDGNGTSPKHITIDVAIAASPDHDGENLETPTSPKDVAGTPRSSVFSKRAGITPATPPVKESRSKKSPPVHEERPKRKGCCVIV